MTYILGNALNCILRLESSVASSVSERRAFPDELSLSEQFSPEKPSVSIQRSGLFESPLMNAPIRYEAHLSRATRDCFQVHTRTYISVLLLPDTPAYCSRSLLDTCSAWPGLCFAVG